MRRAVGLTSMTRLAVRHEAGTGRGIGNERADTPCPDMDCCRTRSSRSEICCFSSAKHWGADRSPRNCLRDWSCRQFVNELVQADAPAPAALLERARGLIELQRITPAAIVPTMHEFRIGQRLPPRRPSTYVATPFVVTPYLLTDSGCDRAVARGKIESAARTAPPR